MAAYEKREKAAMSHNTKVKHFVDDPFMRMMDKKLGPGGKLIADSEYIENFGECSAECPYGDKVMDGLLKWFNEKYCVEAKKAYQLDGHEIKFGWFISPHHLSKKRAELPPSQEDLMLAERYPALFFRDVFSPLAWKMVCVKIMIGGSDFWWVHEDRACITVDQLVEQFRRL